MELAEIKKQKTAPLISVIVPVYKVKQYLIRCIESVLKQTFTDFELILVDDGSPDECGEICDLYSAKDKRIRVIHQDNQRISVARNNGLEAAGGKWIAFMDADDWIHKDYLRILASGIRKDTAAVICGFSETSNEIERDREYSGPFFRDASLHDIMNDHYIHTRVWGRLYRKDQIGDLRFIPVADQLA